MGLLDGYDGHPIIPHSNPPLRKWNGDWRDPKAVKRLQNMHKGNKGWMVMYQSFGLIGAVRLIEISFYNEK